MWMTRSDSTSISFAAARDEGISRFDEIASNYLPKIGISEEEFREYLSKDISYTVDDELRLGMELYFDLARKLGLIESVRELKYAG
jgi:predicted solute-binding protein